MGASIHFAEVGRIWLKHKRRRIAVPGAGYMLLQRPVSRGSQTRHRDRGAAGKGGRRIRRGRRACPQPYVFGPRLRPRLQKRRYSILCASPIRSPKFRTHSGARHLSRWRNAGPATLGKGRRHGAKSDSLVVLRAQESCVHGEATKQKKTDSRETGIFILGKT